METESNLEYIRPEDRIYKIATDKNEISWKSFLHDLIKVEGLDPFDIDIGILTKRYLEALKEMRDVDFNISGKFLTIAVFLLKTKAESLVERDIRGIEEKIEAVNSQELDFEVLDEFDQGLEELEVKKQKREKYSLKVRNPLARKRKVNIFDLIKTLEKTFEQSNRRRLNFFLKNQQVEYSGPTYEKKKRDLKQIIEELFEVISKEFENKQGHVSFNHISKDVEHRWGLLEKFIPLLHLHNQNKIYLKQEKHLGEIKIFKTSK